MPEGFAPVAREDAVLLILGTMPSAQSLQRREYYGHPRNGFWPILFALWGAECPADYEQRCRFLLDRRIALWDVLRDCQRDGSADAVIRQPRANDFTGFQAGHPHIRAMFFNSRNAETFYHRLVAPDPFFHLPQTVLPSTSPARAMKWEEKKTAWQPLRDRWDAIMAEERD